MGIFGPRRYSSRKIWEFTNGCQQSGAGRRLAGGSPEARQRLAGGWLAFPEYVYGEAVVFGLGQNPPPPGSLDVPAEGVRQGLQVFEP